MLENKLFEESPILGTLAVGAVALSIYKNNHIAIGICSVILLMLLWFYRFDTLILHNIPDCVILSPAEGVISKIIKSSTHTYVAIFMSPFNRHTQVYPANCKVIKRTYDDSGKFEIVMDLDKSKYNEKYIHTLQMTNGGTATLTQIAGFLPRVIVASEKLGEYSAGDYLGMIKFGSRIDLLLPNDLPDGKTLHLSTVEDSPVKIGNYLASYV
jgi:phosphatidylserine decarboxylase